MDKKHTCNKHADRLKCPNQANLKHPIWITTLGYIAVVILTHSYRFEIYGPQMPAPDTR